MSKFDCEISGVVLDKSTWWSNKTTGRFHKALDSLCENPELGSRQTKADIWYFAEKSETPHIHITYRIDRRLRRVKVRDVNVPIIQQIRHIFLSYSQKDRKWLEEIRRELRPVEDDLDVRLWCDKDILPGQTWCAVIQEKLSDVRVALLLVSETFLKSEFIREYELRKFLARAESRTGEKFLLLWVPLASKKAIEIDDLGKRLLDQQALRNPEEPLNEIRSEKLVEGALWKLCLDAYRAIYLHLHKSA